MDSKKNMRWGIKMATWKKKKRKRRMRIFLIACTTMLSVYVINERNSNLTFILSQSGWMASRTEVLKKTQICFSVAVFFRKDIFSSKTKKDVTVFKELTSQKHKQSLIAYGKMS